MSLLKNKRVLIVEDTTIAATYLARELSKMGANVVGLARTEQQAFEQVEKYQPELVLLDIHLAEGGSGIEVARELTSRYEIPLVYTTSFSDDDTLAKALNTAPYGYIVKPFDSKTIKVTCETALQRFALEQKVVTSEKRFKVAAEAAQFGVVELDGKGKVFSFDGAQSLKNRFGAGTQIRKDDFLGLFPVDERTEVMESLKKRSSIRKTIRIEEPGQEEKWLDIVFSEIALQDNDVIVGAVIDVTDKQRQITQLKLSNIILDQLAEGVAILDHQYCIKNANRALSDLLQLPVEHLQNQQIFSFGHQCELLRSKAISKNKGEKFREKIVLMKADGSEFPAFITVSELEHAYDSAHYVATISDISELSRAEKKLEALAFTDQLTGAANRNYLKLILNDEKHLHSIRALIFLDLDGFKLINDTYGHHTGDELLAECANRIREVIRQEDVFVRHGGDEFVILVQEQCDLPRLGERLLGVFEQPVVVNDLSLKVSASIGIAESSGAEKTGSLLKHADIAMYEAKKRGKNQVVFYSVQQNDAIEYRLYVEQGLYNAILNKELHASFQPIVGADAKIVALEALCRWRSQDIGDIHPDSFIPIAEETGMINALGLKMLREVCIANVLLRESDLADIKLHVNVSILQLNSNAMVEQFTAYLNDFDVDPSSLVLEVTESAMHDIGTRKVLRELAKSGFGIALDDFGAGYASVSELSEPSTTMVKLDKSLAPTEDSANKKNIIASSLIQLCNKLGKTVLLEGIETEAQAVFAREAGCDYMQGYLFARPMSLSQAINLIKAGEEVSA